ncbi:MAG: ribonuclease HI family protein [Candidatus Woesearchaeota archaeon]
MVKKLLINADGGSRGNPGPAAIGIVIRNEKNKILYNHSERIGIATNNVAEYKSLIKALELAKDFDGEPTIFMDSELVVRQMKGEYKVKAKNILPLFQRAKMLEKGFSKITYKNVKRTDNMQQVADNLVNKALDNGP